MSRQCWLKKDRQERITIKRGWFTTAWRIVDQNGVDMVQPWCRTKKEAKGLAIRLGYKIEGERP